jgi:hypothetical protein
MSIHIAELHKNEKTNKYEMCINGKSFMSSNSKDYVIKYWKERKIVAQYNIEEFIDQTGEVTATVGDNDISEKQAALRDKFDIHQRYDFMNQMIKMVANKTTTSLIISGEGGTGKTHAVMQVLKDEGLKEGLQYEVIKGFSTPKAMYRALYNAQDKIVVFDDCDSVLKDLTSLNILKACLDSYDKRMVAWRSERMDEDLPDMFEFKGSIIFITNVPVDKLSGPILSRAMLIDVAMTSDEKVDRISKILPDLATAKDTLTEEEKMETFELFSDQRANASDLNIRTMQKMLTIREGAKESGSDWKALAEYAMMQ